MRSAIFNKDSAPDRKKPRATSWLHYKKAKSLSPYIGKKLDPKPAVSWKFEDLLASYNESGYLPPILSPTLPPQFEVEESDTNKQNIRARVLNEELGKYESDDDLPLLMLSPTLPAIFNTERTLEPSRPRVRYINQISNKGRFLVRIKFVSRDRFRSVGVTGLGIRIEKTELEQTKVKAQKDSEPPGHSINTSGLGPEWLRGARETEALASQNKTLASACMYLDLVLQYAVACDKEESGRTSTERSWTQLGQALQTAANHLEQMALKYEDHKLKTYLLFFVGLLIQLRGIVLKRVNSIFAKVVDGYKPKSDTDTVHSQAYEYQRKIIDNYNAMLDHFSRARTYFNCPGILVMFPKAWHIRSKRPPKQQGAINLVQDKFCLPLGIYSGLNEYAAFMYHSATEFLDLYPEAAHNFKQIRRMERERISIQNGL